jgi:hypothetical protein
MERVSAPTAKAIDELIGYLHAHHHRINYGAERRCGYPLGSGGIEAANNFSGTRAIATTCSHSDVPSVTVPSSEYLSVIDNGIGELRNSKCSPMSRFPAYHKLINFTWRQIATVFLATKKIANYLMTLNLPG